LHKFSLATRQLTRLEIALAICDGVLQISITVRDEAAIITAARIAVAADSRHSELPTDIEY
jgi:hypothetical protein